MIGNRLPNYDILLKIRPCYALLIIKSECQEILLVYKLQYVIV